MSLFKSYKYKLKKRWDLELDIEKWRICLCGPFMWINYDMDVMEKEIAYNESIIY